MGIEPTNRRRLKADAAPLRLDGPHKKIKHVLSYLYNFVTYHVINFISRYEVLLFFEEVLTLRPNIKYFRYMIV